MKRTIIGLALFLLIVSTWAGTSLGNKTESSTYKVVHGWPRLPDGFTLGQVAGVEVDSHDHVFIFHRSSRTWVGECIVGKSK